MRRLLLTLTLMASATITYGQVGDPDGGGGGPGGGPPGGGGGPAPPALFSLPNFELAVNVLCEAIGGPPMTHDIYDPPTEIEVGQNELIEIVAPEGGVGASARGAEGGVDYEIRKEATTPQSATIDLYELVENGTDVDPLEGGMFAGAGCSSEFKFEAPIATGEGPGNPADFGGVRVKVDFMTTIGSETYGKYEIRTSQNPFAMPWATLEFKGGNPASDGIWVTYWNGQQQHIPIVGTTPATFDAVIPTNLFLPENIGNGEIGRWLTVGIGGSQGLGRGYLSIGHASTAGETGGRSETDWAFTVLPAP